MTESERTWLKTTFIEEYFEVNKVLTEVAASAYYEAERILTGAEKINKRNCKCELPNLKKYVTLKFKKFLEDELHKS